MTRHSLCFAICLCTRMRDSQDDWPLRTRTVVWRYNRKTAPLSPKLCRNSQKRSRSSKTSTPPRSRDRLYLLAAVWMNLANAGLAEASTQSEKRAEEAAHRAITLVADLETNDVHIAEVGMKARHVLCHVIARRLSQITDTDARMLSDVHDATDAADDGLALARRWEQKGVARFREIAVDLFRFGIRVYAKYQPQFLREFISDNMDPSRSSREYVESPAMRMAAQEGLAACGRMG